MSVSEQYDDYICLTDIAKFKNADHSDDVIRNWLCSRSTVEFLGVWERLNNPDFNPVEFDGISQMQTLTLGQTGIKHLSGSDETKP